MFLVDTDAREERTDDDFDLPEVASPSASSSFSTSSSYEESSSENGMAESDSGEERGHADEGEEYSAGDSEEENLFSVLSASSFSKTPPPSTASPVPASQQEVISGKGEKELLESMRRALVKMYAAQKQSRREQRQAQRRARKLQHDNRRLRAELRRVLNEKTGQISWDAEEADGEEESREERGPTPVVAPGMCKQPADAAKPWYGPPTYFLLFLYQETSFLSEGLSLWRRYPRVQNPSVRAWQFAASCGPPLFFSSVRSPE